MKFVEDKEKILKIDQDLLNTKVYSDSLIDAINHLPTPFTIGLFGEWGSGKSSIIKTTEEELEKDSNNKYKVVTYDAWKYSNDSFRRMFLLHIAEKLKFLTNDEKDKIFRKFYTNENKDIDIKKELDPGPLMFMAPFFLGLIVLSFVSDFSYINQTRAFLTIGLIVMAFYKNAFRELKVAINKPLLFAPEQFEAIFNEMLDKSLKELSVAEKINEVWFKSNSYEQGIDRLVIVIDNVDRCDAEHALSLLSDIKTFLSDRENVIFILPVDDLALKRHISQVKNTNDREADEFLRKFFNSTIKIKPLKTRDLFNFTDKINNDNKLYLLPDTVEVLSNEYASNPRRIIQCLNNLILEKNVLEKRYDTAFVKENEPLIAILLIIREEWPILYECIFKAPHLLHSFKELESEYKELFSHKFSNQNQKKSPEREGLTSEQNAFLNKTKYFLEKTEIKIIEKMLRNRDQSIEVSDELIDALYTRDKEAIQKIIGSDKLELKNLVSYMVENFQTYEKRNVFDTGGIPMFENLLFLNSLQVIEASDNKRIQCVIARSLDKLVHDKLDISTFVQYMCNLNDQGIEYLLTFTLSKLNNVLKPVEKDSSIEPGYEPWTEYLAEIIRKTDDENILKQLQNPFYQVFKEEGFWLEDIELPPDKYRYIINNDFIKLEINSYIKDADRWGEVVLLGENNVLHQKNIEYLFMKLNERHAQFNNISVESIIDYIKEINEILKSYNNDDIENTAEIEQYVNKLFNKRNIQIQGNPHPQQVLLVNEIINDEERMQIIAEFFFQLYRTSSIKSNMPVIISEKWSGFIKVNASRTTLFYDFIIRLKNELGVYCKPFYETLSQRTDFSKPLLEIYDWVLTREKNGKYEFSDDMSRGVINRLLEHLITNSSAEENLVDFFDKILKDKYRKSMIAELVIEYEKDKFLSLPENIQANGFNNICVGDKIFDYENDLDLLKAIVKQNKLSFNKKIVKVIRKKLLTENTIEEGLELLESYNGYFDNFEKEKIRGDLEDLKNDASYKERVKKLLKDFKTKKSK